MNIKRGLKRVGLVGSVALGLWIGLHGVSSALKDRAASRHWERIETRRAVAGTRESPTFGPLEGRGAREFKRPSDQRGEVASAPSRTPAELTKEFQFDLSPLTLEEREKQLDARLKAIDRSAAIEATTWLLFGLLTTGVAYGAWTLTLRLCEWVIAGFTGSK